MSELRLRLSASQSILDLSIHNSTLHRVYPSHLLQDEIT